jgi:hypothetical protein
MTLFWIGVMTGLGIATMGVVITYIITGPVKEYEEE